MNKNILHILIAVLVVSQVTMMFKISDLQREIDYTNRNVNQMSDRMRDDIGAIYSNVDEMLQKKASLLETADVKIETFDADELTVPVTFVLTPKEVSEHTAVSLDFGGELFAMKKDGTTFSATVQCDVFGDASPMVVIDENGVKKTTQDDRINIGSMKDSVLPIMFPMISGQSRYDGKVYQRSGLIHTDTKPVESGITFVQTRLVIKVDDKIISEKTIPSEASTIGYEVEEEIAMSDGQVCIMTIVATDSIGYEHHYQVDHWVAGSNVQREPMFGEEKIYSPDGTLVWQSNLVTN